MAGFHTKSFIKHDDYMTPKSAWENIVDFIPKDKVIWEAFYGDGQSGKDLTDLGFNVIHEPIDFFDNDKGDIVITNPPFSKKKEVFTRLYALDKPFIVICPTSILHAVYWNQLSHDKKIQLIIPKKRIQFIKNGNEKENKCNFDCLYFCYKMDLERDITYLKTSPRTKPT
tara:strand:+ start:3509 stop:4018 length:510 start_codon:yes stop_codon:yes gene_type:complete